MPDDPRWVPDDPWWVPDDPWVLATKELSCRISPLTHRRSSERRLALRIRTILGVANLILVLSTSPLPATANWADGDRFCELVEPFVSAWTNRDLGRLDELIDPSVGFWVIHQLGVRSLASRFHSVEEPLELGEHGFAYLGTVGFEGCRPDAGRLLSVAVWARWRPSAGLGAGVVAGLFVGDDARGVGVGRDGWAGGFALPSRAGSNAPRGVRRQGLRTVSVCVCR